MAQAAQKCEAPDGSVTYADVCPAGTKHVPSTVDPPPPDAKYTRGVVAMAKTLDEPRGTAGSQFFIVTGADVGLPPDYAIVGKVTDGMDTLDAIDALLPGWA